MDKVHFEQLCSHYKDTYSLHLQSVKQRDTFFYLLLLLLALLALRFSNSDVVVEFLATWVKKSTGSEVVDNPSFLTTLIWLSIAIVITKYFQTCITIERQYSYINELEAELNSQYPRDSASFTREGKSYLVGFPIFSNWIHLLFAYLIPIGVAACSVMSLVVQHWEKSPQDNPVNLWIDTTCCVVIVISSVLYFFSRLTVRGSCT